jgi:hypothetical protein
MVRAMDLIPTQEARTALIERAKNILVQPKAEWPRIETEPATVGSIYSNYVVYVAAVPVLATLIGSLVFGYSFGGLTYRPSIGAALTTAVLQYALQLGGVYVFALIVDFLAPKFGGRQDRISAFKLAAYSATASWLAGVFGLVPALGFLSILGLYSLYLIYTGVPVLMKVPQERALPYTATLVVIALVLGIVLGSLGAAFLPSPTTQGEVTGKVTLPGGVTVDVDRLDEATKRMEYIAKQMEGAVPIAPGDGEQAATGDGQVAQPGLSVIAPNDLRSLLPQSLPGGFTRGEVKSSTAGAGGFSFGTANADYASGDARIALSLTDMGPMGAFAALGGIFGASASEETDTSYSKIGQVDGRTTVEEFNRDTNFGKYAVVVGNRIMVEAAGTGASMDALKAAVAAVDLGRAEALASK